MDKHNRRYQLTVEQSRRRGALCIVCAAAVLAIFIAEVTFVSSHKTETISHKEETQVDSEGTELKTTQDASRTLELLESSGNPLKKFSKQLTDGVECEQRTVQNDLSEAAKDVLEEYRKSRECVLVHAGYLDLRGNVWSCVVLKDNESEACIIEEKEDNVSLISVIHFDKEKWRESIQSEGICNGDS